MEGRLLARRYRLVSLLGKGGMGSVWVAEHVELGTRVAIKIIDPTMAQSDGALSRFKHEAQAAATLRSTHVVQILDYGVDEDTPFIVMELLSGESLAARLGRVGPLNPEATASVITQTARAVGMAHEIGVIHRDLKPDNVFIVREGDQEICKVLDFGIAKQTLDVLGQAAGPQTQTGTLLGTPYYMSPEQATGMRKLDHRTDIWSMAVIAFECLIGRRPFDQPTLGALLMAICGDQAPIPSQCGRVPPGFDEWFARGVAKDPDHRFGSAREAASALQALCLAGAAWQVSSSPPHLGGPVGVLGGTGGVPTVQVPAPGNPLAAGVAAPDAGGSGLAPSESTESRMPPSAVTVSSPPRPSGFKPLLFGLTAVVLVGAAGALLVIRSAWTDRAISSAASGSAESEVAHQQVAASESGTRRAEGAAVPSASVSPRASGGVESASTSPAGGVAVPTPPAGSVAAPTPSAGSVTAPTPRAAGVDAGPRPAPRAWPVQQPARARLPSQSAKDQLEHGFGF